MLQLLTTTGCRPEAMALCARWMARQTYDGPVRWIVVDDGAKAQPVTAVRDGWSVDVVRPRPFWREGDRTQPRNFVAGLDAASTDSPVVVIEDDDWYSADYLDLVAARLREYEMVGTGPQRWHNVRFRTWGVYGAEWPWTSCIAFRGSAIPHMRAIASTRAAYIDRDAWEQFDGSKRYFPDSCVVGIKGLPGRGGYMTCHHNRQGQRDPSLRQLRAWIGDDVEAYVR